MITLLFLAGKSLSMRATAKCCTSLERFLCHNSRFDIFWLPSALRDEQKRFIPHLKALFYYTANNCSGIAVESLQFILDCSEPWHVVRHCNQQKLIAANFAVIQMQKTLHLDHCKICSHQLLLIALSHYMPWFTAIENALQWFHCNSTAIICSVCNQCHT